MTGLNIMQPRHLPELRRAGCRFSQSGHADEVGRHKRNEELTNNQVSSMETGSIRSQQKPMINFQQAGATGQFSNTPIAAEKIDRRGMIR